MTPGHRLNRPLTARRVCRSHSHMKHPRNRTTLPTRGAVSGETGNSDSPVSSMVTFPSGVNSFSSVAEQVRRTPRISTYCTFKLPFINWSQVGRIGSGSGAFPRRFALRARMSGANAPGVARPSISHNSPTCGRPLRFAGLKWTKMPLVESCTAQPAVQLPITTPRIVTRTPDSACSRDRRNTSATGVSGLPEEKLRAFSREASWISI